MHQGVQQQQLESVEEGVSCEKRTIVSGVQIVPMSLTYRAPASVFHFASSFLKFPPHSVGSRSTTPPMSSIELCRSHLYVATTPIAVDPEDDDTLQIVQWHTTGLTIRIIRKTADEMLDINLQLDQDVESVLVRLIYLCEEKSLTKSVKYDLLNTETPDAVVVLKLLPSRPFNWSASTSFDAANPSNNSVILQVIIQDEDD
jgi:hypothetical protein